MTPSVPEVGWRVEMSEFPCRGAFCFRRWHCSSPSACDGGSAIRPKFPPSVEDLASPPLPFSFSPSPGEAVAELAASEPPPASDCLAMAGRVCRVCEGASVP